MKAIVMALVVLLTLAGCATLFNYTSQPAVQRVIQYGVIKYLQGNKDKATEAERIILSIRRHVDASAETSVGELEALANQYIPWGKLDLADQFILRSLVADISNLLRDEVGSGVLSGDDKIKLHAALGWILEAVRFAGM